MRQAVEAAAPFYASAKLISTPHGVPDRIPASSLQSRLYHGTLFDDAANAVETGQLDRILEHAGLQPADFGTLVHGFLDAQFNGKKPCIPAKLLARLDETHVSLVREAAHTMAERFLNSELGTLGMTASYRETEFPLLSAVQSKGRKIILSGQIDLLFETAPHEPALYVVDFKTDHLEEPLRHAGQLAVYERAVSDIFGKPVRSWIFYLRSGNAVELTPYLKSVDIEKMVDALKV
jgi:ATP-dependent helicase/nuclease subunit A